MPNEKVLQEALKLTGAFFKERREELGLSQEQLAEKIGVHYRTILRMENAQLWPNLKQYFAVCEALNLFPMVSTFEGNSDFSKMMRETWTKKQEAEMSMEDALKLKSNTHIRTDLSN